MMLNFSKHRPRHLTAVYVEPGHVEILRAHRQWRKWNIDSVEQQSMPEGESIFDSLQRLNLKPRGRSSNALLLFLPRPFYSFHREHYPASLKDHLEETLSFDWQENVFLEGDRTLAFSGPPTPVDGHISVPIFSLQRKDHEKFHQVLGGALFQSFAVVPTALCTLCFLPLLPPSDGDGDGDGASSLRFIGRVVGSEHLEIHRYYNGQFLDSVVIGLSPDQVKLFLENLQCLGSGTCPDPVPVHILCTGQECEEQVLDPWSEASLPFRLVSLEEPVILHWVKHLLKQDAIQTFEAPLLLKPWQVPRIAWPLLALVVCYSIFAVYEAQTLKRAQDSVRKLKRESAQLETQWKPIEEFQTRIAKFQEDQKTLSQFNDEGYPLIEILSLLTQITPDDTWLNYLSVRKGQLVLRGESKSAIRYLSELSKLEGFSDVRFASPVTRNPSSEYERFNVQLQIDLEKLRKTLAALPPEVEKAEEEAVEEVPPPPEEAERGDKAGRPGKLGKPPSRSFKGPVVRDTAPPPVPEVEQFEEVQEDILPPEEEIVEDPEEAETEGVQ